MSTEPDPQIQRLLDMLDQQRAPPTYGVSVETARDQLEELFSMSEPEPVGDVRNFEIPGPAGSLPVRVYTPEAGDEPLPVFVTFHGGGWVIGSLDTHDPVCRAVANSTGCLVISVEYRLAPEHPFPAAVEDCYAATEWAAAFAPDLGGDSSKIAVGGDSAGGNLSAAVTLMTRDRDEGFAYADRLDEAGVAVEHEHYEGMIHGFINLVDMVDRSREALGVVANGLERAFET